MSKLYFNIQKETASECCCSKWRDYARGNTTSNNVSVGVARQDFSAAGSGKKRPRSVCSASVLEAPLCGMVRPNQGTVCGSEQGPVADCCKHGCELPVSIKRGKLPDLLKVSTSQAGLCAVELVKDVAKLHQYFRNKLHFLFIN